MNSQPTIDHNMGASANMRTMGLTSTIALWLGANMVVTTMLTGTVYYIAYRYTFFRRPKAS